MTLKPSSLIKTRLYFISPWLSLAAIALLMLIIFVFAVSNIRREEQYLTDTLFRKGQESARFLAAGSRASMMMMGRQDISQIQQFAEQMAEEPDILYIVVLDEAGRILVHSDPEKVDGVISRNRNLLNQLSPEGGWHIVSQPEAIPAKVFEVISPFKPFRRHGMGRGRFMKNHMGRRMFNNDFTPEPQELRNLSILIGIDMRELEKATRQNRLQIVFMSAALLLVGLGGIISLLTAQGYRASQQALQQIQAFTALLVSKLPVGVIATDGNGVIKTFNKSAEALTGIQSGKAVGNRPENVLPPELAPFLDLPATKGDAVEQELSYRPADLTDLSLQVTSVPIIDKEEIPSGRVLLIHDLTRLKRLEQEMQRHEKLAALGKMAAGVAHEVRNPLSSIKGFATLLGSKFGKDSEEKNAANLLVSEVERLNKSITALLDYSRPLPLEKHEVSLHEFLRNSLKLIETDAAELNITVRLETNPDIIRAAVDPDRLNQVLLNIYLNALQAMEPGGSLTVRLKKEERSGFFQIEVEDTGCGIPAEHMQQILTPYFTTKPEGTGLGLAMANKIIDEHGGSIRFSSRLNRGTTATITLPCR